MSETIGEDKGTIAIIDAFTGGTAGVYDGLDQFGRVQNLLWVNYNTSTNVAQIQHGYDYAGNRVWRADPIAAANSVYLDEYYTYDGLNQVTDLQRGQLNAGKTGISSTPAWEEAWTLDALGDWSGYVQNVNGATNLNQTRTHDLANKVTQINSSTTHVASDLAGSMTNLPIPGNWNDHYCMVYDAWNRLVQVLASDGTTNIAQYQYDGRNYRTVKKTYTSGTLSETRHFYYNAGWQCLEERLEASGVISSYAKRQNVWGMCYVDDLILRDRDADGSSATGSLGVSGSGLEERLYSLQDPNWNVIAIANASGSVQERYLYSAYGTPTFLTSAFAARSPNASSYAWDTLYTSRQYDSETGLYHYRNRPYVAELGRFIERDPIGYAGGINPYAYVGDQPLRFVDPNGFTGISHSDCEKGIKDAESDPAVIQMKKEIQADKKCHVPVITCKCCKNGTGGGYDFTTKDITICEEAMNNSDTARDVMRHEYMHAYDGCKGHSPPKDCKERACAEVRAYSTSGQCDDGGGWRMPGDSKKDCVKRNAITSVEIGDPKCKPGKDSVEAVFDQCYVEDHPKAPPKWPMK